MRMASGIVYSTFGMVGSQVEGDGLALETTPGALVRVTMAIGWAACMRYWLWHVEKVSSGPATFVLLSRRDCVELDPSEGT